MQDSLLPLFPLQLVLLPGATLPLHIFEERYKEMIGECLTNQTEFGVVQAGDGGVLNTGCTATVEEVLKRYPDGRMDIVTLGRRRFEIILLNDERSYLRGAVEFFDDEDPADPVDPGLRSRLIAAYNLLRSSGFVEDLPELDESNKRLSFQIAAVFDDLRIRQALLALKSESDRLRLLGEQLPEYVAKRQYVDHMKVVAPRNGHGKSHPPLG